jgi:hypothetical protein
MEAAGEFDEEIGDLGAGVIRLSAAVFQRGLAIIAVSAVMSGYRSARVVALARRPILAARWPKCAQHQCDGAEEFGMLVDRERRRVVLVGRPEPVPAAEHPIIAELDDRARADRAHPRAARAADRGRPGSAAVTWLPA